MSVLTLKVDEVMRTLSAESSNPFVVHDKEIDIVRFAINSGFADIVLDGQVALRVMYQRPGETEVRAQTLTYHDTDGLHNYYDWQLSQSDLAKKGTLTVALCILRTDSEVEEWHTTPCQIRVLDTIHTDDGDEADESITPTVAQRVAVLETMIQRVASGAPIVVASTSAMTDTSQIYVLSTDRKWYYHNGATWVAGGEYGAVATDTTLTQAGIPADAEAAGNAIDNVRSSLPETLDSDAVDVDLDITDPQGNVIARFAGGNIRTKEFDSAFIGDKTALNTTTKTNIVSAINEVKAEADSKIDSEQGIEHAGKALVVGADGSVIPKDIEIDVDSTLTESGSAADAEATGNAINSVRSRMVSTEPTDSVDVDLDITDPQGNVIARFADGNIRTKEFDSANYSLIYSGQPSHQQVIFTKDDVNVGDVISLIFTVARSSQGSFFDMLDTSGRRITYIGRTSAGEEKIYSVTYTIPANFGRAVAACQSNQMIIHAVLKTNTFIGANLSNLWSGNTQSGRWTLEDRYFLTNKLANPLFTSREKFNADNPTEAIDNEAALYRGVTGSAGYRIPATIITNSGTVLVAGTHMTRAAGDYGDFSIDVARKPVGGTWSISEVVPFDSTREDYGSVLNNEFLADRNTGRIYLFYGTEKSKVVWWEVTTEDGDLRYVYSDDDGVTWSNPISLKRLWDTAAYDYCIPSCTKGITLTNGTFVVPCFCKQGFVGNTAHSYPLLLIKPPSGDWYFSSVAEVEGILHLDECAVVEGDTANSVWLYCRPNTNYGIGANRGYNKFLYQIQNDTFKLLEPSYFETNRHNCFSIDRITINSTKIYLMSFTDTHSSVRDNLTLWGSLDGNVWIRVYRINKESSAGYSVLDNYNGVIGVSYEYSNPNDGASEIRYQDLSGLSDLIYDSVAGYIGQRITVQDRMQMLFNAANGID